MPVHGGMNPVAMAWAEHLSGDRRSASWHHQRLQHTGPGNHVYDDISPGAERAELRPFPSRTDGKSTAREHSSVRGNPAIGNCFVIRLRCCFVARRSRHGELMEDCGPLSQRDFPVWRRVLRFHFVLFRRISLPVRMPIFYGRYRGLAPHRRNWLPRRRPGNRRSFCGHGDRD